VAGDFRESRVAFEVPQLTAGDHIFGVTAFDNLNNSTTSEYSLVVGQRVTGAANVVYVYPNPAGGRCYIIWEYENDDYIEVKATIYTLAGRKIWTGSTAGRSSQHVIEWDGEDSAGDAVANGTYLAVVEARAQSDPGFETKDTIAIALVR
jgi:flagellar hook assembly protein FlgD